MLEKNKNLPKTSQQISDEADSASARAFASQGLAPYDQDKEEIEASTASPVDKLDASMSNNDDFLNKLKAETGAGDAEVGAGRVALSSFSDIDPEISIQPVEPVNNAGSQKIA